MALDFHAISLATGRIARAGVAPLVGAARGRLGGWGARLAAALKEPELASPEDYERELRERVFHPPQP